MAKSKGIFLQRDLDEKDNTLTAKRRARWRLPEGLIPSDFSPTENLIELEDLTSGERPWFRVIDLLNVDLRVGHDYLMICNTDSTCKIRFKTIKCVPHGKYHYLLPVFDNLGECPCPKFPIEWEKGICRECGCSENNACHNHSVGNCYWVDESETLCSHCSSSVLRNDPITCRLILK